MMVNKKNINGAFTISLASIESSHERNNNQDKGIDAPYFPNRNVERGLKEGRKR